MNAENEIKRLQNKIELLKLQQYNCNHTWNDAKYDAEEVIVQDDRGGYETHGVHRYPVPSFHKETKDRWSRECSKCGLKQYTYENEAVITKREPKF
jgi:hypothetical protein